MNPTEEPQNTDIPEQQPNEKQDSREFGNSRLRKRPMRPMGRSMGRMAMPGDYYYRPPMGPHADRKYPHPMMYRGYPSYAGYQQPPHPYRMDMRVPGPYNYPAYPREYGKSWPMYYDDQRVQRDHMMRRRRPLNAEQVPVNVLGVFGLDVQMNEEDLSAWLKKIIPDIPIAKLQLVFSRRTEQSRGFAFIYFNSVEDATAAKEQLTGQTCNGFAVRVEYSITASGYKRDKPAPEAADSQQQPPARFRPDTAHE